MNLFLYVSAIALSQVFPADLSAAFILNFNVVDCAPVIRDDALSYGISLF